MEGLEEYEGQQGKKYKIPGGQTRFIREAKESDVMMQSVCIKDVI